MRAQITRRSIRLHCVAVSVAIGALAACAGQQVKPDDMSARRHRAVAAEERAEAASEKRAYDPSATVERVQVPVDAAAAGGAAVIRTDSNPTDSHLAEAASLNAHAKAHEEAAAELEKSESRSCEGIAAASRASCPVIGPISRRQDLQDGVRLYLSKAAQVEDVFRRMRCHYAFAEARGFKDGAGCPLYIKDLDLRVSPDGKAIDLIGRTTFAADEIQRRARVLVNSSPDGHQSH